MFDRAASSLVAVAAACAAVAVAVVAAGFALYALLLPHVGPAGGAALVACAAALGVGIYAIVAHERAKVAEREAHNAHNALLESIPDALGGLTRDHPLLTLAVSVLGGVVAVRHPQLTRELVSLMASFTNRRT